MLRQGYARLPRLIAEDELPALRPRNLEFVPLVEEVGLVRQAGWFAQLGRDDAPPGVHAIAERVEAAARAVASGSSSGLAHLRFNEATYQRYPAGAGYLSPHRDQAFYRLLIVVVTIAGAGRFSVLRERDAGAVEASWTTAPGDVVLLRGAGLTRPDDRCPFHAVDPPSEDRLSLTLRDNTLGPGGGWGGTRSYSGTR